MFTSKTPFFSNEVAVKQVLRIAAVASSLLRLLRAARLPPFPPMSPCKSKIYKGFLFMGVFNSPGTHTNRPDRLGGLDPKPSQIPGVVHTAVPVMPTNVKTARITGRRFKFEDIVDIANALVQ